MVGKMTLGRVKYLTVVKRRVSITFACKIFTFNRPAAGPEQLVSKVIVVPLGRLPPFQLLILLEVRKISSLRVAHTETNLDKMLLYNMSAALREY